MTGHPAPRSSTWSLADAKERFDELARRAETEGPQHVTAHGHEEVVVISAETFKRLTTKPTGQAIIVAMQAIPHQELEFDIEGTRSPVRDVDL